MKVMENRAVFNEQTAQPTSIDLVIKNDHREGWLFVESKFIEKAIKSAVHNEENKGVEIGVAFKRAEDGTPLILLFGAIPRFDSCFDGEKASINLAVYFSGVIVPLNSEDEADMKLKEIGKIFDKEVGKENYYVRDLSELEEDED